ncbi:MAG: hypothetical protein PVI30_24555 [Myxococcales bacterium]|jgi:hypothetical protein
MVTVGSDQVEEARQRALWDAALPRSEPALRPWFLPLLALLTVLSVPFHDPWGMADRVWLGLPLWVWGTLACSAALSAVTAAGALWGWRDDPPSNPSAAPSADEPSEPGGREAGE